VTDGTATFRLRVGTTHAGEPTDTEALHAALRVVREHTDDAPLDDAALQYDRVVSTDPLGKPDTGDANREIRAISIAIPKPISIAVPPRQSTSSPTKNPNPRRTTENSASIAPVTLATTAGRGSSRAPCGERMSTVAMSGERVRVWRVVPTIVHPDADVDVSTIEPETGLTQRAARECAAERNRRRDPDATVQWVAKPTGRVADRGDVLDQVRSKTNSP